MREEKCYACPIHINQLSTKPARCECDEKMKMREETTTNACNASTILRVTMTPEEKANNIFEEFSNFMNGTRVFFRIHRNKEGGKWSESNDHASKKTITNSDDEARNALCTLITEIDSSDKPYRLQLSVNSRNIDKAIREFKRRQLDSDYYDYVSRHSFYLKIKNNFISCLMNPSSAGTSYFLFDCDTQKEYDLTMNLLQKEKVAILKDYSTKNGRHIITEPHNPAHTSTQTVHVNKDGLLLLYWKEKFTNVE